MAICASWQEKANNYQTTWQEKTNHNSGPTDGEIFGALPLLPHNMVVSGHWEVQNGEPVWVWCYADGKKEHTKAIDVAWQSTKQSDRELFLQEVTMKVDQIYTHFNLPSPPDHQLQHQISTRSARWACWLHWLWKSGFKHMQSCHMKKTLYHIRFWRTAHPSDRTHEQQCLGSANKNINEPHNTMKHPLQNIRCWNTATNYIERSSALAMPQDTREASVEHVSSIKGTHFCQVFFATPI